MKTQIIILASALLVASVTGLTCACTELTQQADCTAASWCNWSNSACAAATVTCNSTTQAACDQIVGCGWTNNSTCSAFTKCSDYTVTDSSLCYAKDVTCSPGTVSNGSYPCVTQNVTSCSTITDQTTCTNNGCAYASSACGAANVSALTLSTCFNSTNGAYEWNSTSSACQACQGSSSSTTTTPSSNSYLLGAIGLVGVMLF